MKNGFIKRALKLAEKSDYYPFRIGSIVIKHGRIISEGFNRVGSCKRIDPYYQFRSFSIHAEADALSKLSFKDAKGASIIIVRMNISHNIANAKPCIYCQEMIYDYGIKNVYCSNNYGKIDHFKVINNNKNFLPKRNDEIEYYDKYLKLINTYD